MEILKKALHRSIMLSAFLAAPFAASTHAADQTDVIYQKDYGSKWAFTIDRAIIKCDRQSALLIDPATNITYPLNGLARTRMQASGKKIGNIDNIWRNNPDIPGAGIDISPFINKALELCE